MAKTTARKSTEREDPLKAAGLEPKLTTGPLPDTSPAGDEIPAPPGTHELQEKSKGRELKPDEEKATEKVTAYFTIGQYDKIEELQRAYRKKAHKRISVNALLRRLVERAAVEDILP